MVNGFRKLKNSWSIVMVEMTSSCNFSCEFCPSDKLIRKKAMMPSELWRKVLKELGEKEMCGTVFFHLVGEPLLHKEIFQAIAYANHYGLSVSLYTNGALLTDEKSSLLLDALKKGRVVLSLQDVNPEGFAGRSRGNISWEEYIGRLKNFLIKAEAGNVDVQIHCMVDVPSAGINFVKLLRMKQDVQKIYNGWCGKIGACRPDAINILNPAGSYRLGRSTSFFIKHRGWWSNQHIPGFAEVIQSTGGHCALMNDTFVVLADGTCTFCCGDYEGKLNLGNAGESSLEAIFYGAKSVEIRQAEQRGEMTQELCKICRGRLVDRRTKKPVLTRNILSEYYFFQDHLKRYGVGSTIRKIKENVGRRLFS